MSSVPPARRHHTVPQFYLRGFADGETLRTIALPGKRRYRQSVRDASVETDFYALPGHPEGDDVLERALSEVEGAAAAVLRLIVEGCWPLDVADRTSLGYFIALQSTRTQVNRRTADSLAAFAARLEIGFGGRERFKARLERDGRTVPDEEVQQLWDEAMRPEGPPLQVSHGEFAEQMLKTADGLLKYLIGRPWTLVRFDRRSLITSDSPVSLVAQPDANEWEGVGYMTAWGIMMPLTRKLGLIMGDPTPFHGRVPVEEVHQGLWDTFIPVGTTAYERFFNEHTIGHSSQWLYCHPGDEHRVPDDLPEPRLVNMHIQNDPWKFNGEPNGVV